NADTLLSRPLVWSVISADWGRASGVHSSMQAVSIKRFHSDSLMAPSQGRRDPRTVARAWLGTVACRATRRGQTDQGSVLCRRPRATRVKHRSVDLGDVR